jgi:hypothetical protein
MANIATTRSLTQAIVTYSCTGQPSKIASDLGSANVNSALLQKIVSLMAAGAAALAARKYQTAISEYRAAESLIYAHLDPQWDPELGPSLNVSLPRDATLFDPLLSAASQWLNILSVPTPISPVRPLLTTTELPLVTTRLHGAGLGMASATPAATAETVSDIRLASIYASEGNAVASSAAVERAEAEDGATASSLESALGLSAASAAPGSADLTKPTAKLRADTTRHATAKTTAAAPVATIPVLGDIPPKILAQRQVGIVTGASPNYSIVSLQWPAAGSPAIATIKSYLYAPHVSATTLPDAQMVGGGLWQQALNLPYLYFYVIPVALGQSYQGLGDYQKAITEYFLAAQYTYINTAVEGPFLWVQLANCYLSAGDALYQKGDVADALTQYSNVLQPGNATAPSTQLYTTSSLSVAANIAKTLIPQLASLAANGIGNLSSDDTLIATVLLKVFGRLGQINANLDFWGIYAAAVPIWTFAYLQQIAINFTQLAIEAEQQVINFWAQSEAAALTVDQLQGQVSQANGQVAAASAAVATALTQAVAYGQAVTMANTRASDAAADATEYQTQNSQALEDQALASVTSQGNDYSDGLFWPYSSAQQMLDNSAGDDSAEAAGEQWQAGTYSQQYQVDSMNRTTTEMQQAAVQAQLQADAANAQFNAALTNLAVAQAQASTAQQTLDAYDANTLTPQVWAGMGNFMWDIYMSYMGQAITIAKLMQQAYNFENDTNLTYIQDSYSGVVVGLLGADALMADIQNFTYDLATTTRGKIQLVKTSISLATNYAYRFNTQFIPTGTMSFETSLDDFDSEYPGSYQGRIQSVSVSVQGIVPPSGISGTLTNGGISWYRLPSDIATSSNNSKLRIQNSDTLVLSDYSPSQDGPLSSTDGSQQLGIFQGAGVASTWVLSLPPSINDIDYNAVTDVVLTFLYETRFDSKLIPTVLAGLASRPGFYSRQRAIPLAWLYPDLFYAFHTSGTLTLSLAASDFPYNQTNPIVTAVGVLLTSLTPSSLNGVTISVSAPGQTAVAAQTNASGSISSQTNSTLSGLVGGPAIGNWIITISAANNPNLVSNGQLNLSAFMNMTLLFDYTFVPRN